MLDLVYHVEHDCIIFNWYVLVGMYFNMLNPKQSCACVSDWPISIQIWVYIFPSVEFSIYVLTF